MGKKDEELVVAEVRNYFGGTGTQGRVMATFRKMEFVEVSLRNGHIEGIRRRMHVNYFGVFQNGRFLRLLS